MHHILKSHPAMFRAVRDGGKRFETRKDDRAFQKGDTVELHYNDNPRDGSYLPMAQPPIPFDPKDDRKPLNFRIGFVLRGGQYGIEPGYVVFMLEDIEPSK